MQHTFKKGGQLTVKEKIHTDDLASPVIEVERKVNVVAAPTIGSEEAEVKPNGLTVVTEGDRQPESAEKPNATSNTARRAKAIPFSLPCTPEPGSGETAKEVSATILAGS